MGENLTGLLGQFFCQVFGCNAENAVWSVPGSHKWGHLDLLSLVERHGERLPGALPCICEPGDIVMQSRNSLHVRCNRGFRKMRASESLTDSPLLVAEVVAVRRGRLPTGRSSGGSR